MTCYFVLHHYGNNSADKAILGLRKSLLQTLHSITQKLLVHTSPAIGKLDLHGYGDHSETKSILKSFPGGPD